jgi:hypothetical protein
MSEVTMSNQHRYLNFLKNKRLLAVLAVCLFQFGCTQLGPDFVKPELPQIKDWSDDNPAISRDAVELNRWWTVFNDPVLNELVEKS